MGAQKKLVAIYVIEEERLQDVHEDMNPEIEILPYFYTGCQVQSGAGWSGPEWSGITPEWVGFDNKMGTTLASAHALCLNLLSCVWLRISGGWNCCQEIRKGVEMDIKGVNDFNLQTKERGCNYQGTYTKSGRGGVQVISLHCDPIGVDNRSLGAKTQ